MLVSLAADGLVNKLVYANYEYILIVGAVEYGDIAPAGDLTVHAPQKVMG